MGLNMSAAIPTKLFVAETGSPSYLEGQASKETSWTLF